MAIPEEQLNILHDPQKGSRTEIEYRLAWTRTYLKKYGLLENSSRGVWALTPEGRKINKVNPRDVKRFVRDETRAKKQPSDIDDPDKTEAWQSDLMETLLSMHPAAFERLFQRVLREAGFVQVEVTGQSGDGGIDGTGILRLGGFLSFRVLFQCKRWQGSIGASVVRDFRGAMVGRADKGLLVTTGNFTKDAVKEATRDGAPAIDLIDGDQLMAQLQLFSLGVRTEEVISQKITIDQEWLLSL